MSNVMDFLQGASNAAAETVAGPVDLIAWALRKAGVPVPQNALLSSDWMRQQGLMAQPQNALAGMAGETVGLLSPVVAAAKAPQIAAGLLRAGENAAKPRTLHTQKGAIVYHGSPHKFDRFDASKIGTGEGAQAYGHGLYLAESPDVAKSYAESVSRLHGATTTVEGAGRKVPVPLWAADRVKSEGIDSLIDEWSKRLVESQASAKTSLQPWIDEGNAARFAQQLDELKAIKAGGAVNVEAPGSLYKVDLPDTAIARMLDWDKPLSQQAPGVQNTMARVFGDDIADDGTDKLHRLFGVWDAKDLSGERLYMEMNRRAAGRAAANLPDAAKRLSKAGIPGIRYLDGGSRGAGSGTSNFVVFPGEENLLRILERNGQPLGLLGP